MLDAFFPRGERPSRTVRSGSELQVAAVVNSEAPVGPMLLEPQPTRTIEVRGQILRPHRYSLFFAPYELNNPKTAEQLAATALAARS